MHLAGAPQIGIWGNAFVSEDMHDAERLQGLDDAFLSGILLCLIGRKDALARHPLRRIDRVAILFLLGLQFCQVFQLPISN